MLSMRTQDVNDPRGGEGLELVSEGAYYWVARAKSYANAGVVLKGKDVFPASTYRPLAPVPKAISNDASRESAQSSGGMTKRMLAELAVSVRPNNTTASTISYVTMRKR